MDELRVQPDSVWIGSYDSRRALCVQGVIHRYFDHRQRHPRPPGHGTCTGTCRRTPECRPEIGGATWRPDTDIEEDRRGRRCIFASRQCRACPCSKTTSPPSPSLRSWLARALTSLWPRRCGRARPLTAARASASNSKNTARARSSGCSACAAELLHWLTETEYGEGENGGSSPRNTRQVRAAATEE